MKILIAGNGARAHMLGVYLKMHGHKVSSVSTYPNSGLRALGNNYVVQDFSDFTRFEEYDLVVPCTEVALFAGMVDAAKACGVAAFGPPREVALLECRKDLQKSQAHTIRPDYALGYSITEDVEHVRGEHKTSQSVIKFAVGTSNCIVFPGQELPDNLQEATTPFLIEPHLGEWIDFTIYVIQNRTGTILSPIITDFPFRLPGHQGPKTGGMGASSYVGCPPFLTTEQFEAVQQFTREFAKPLAQQFGGIVGVQFMKHLTTDQIVYNETDYRPGDPELVNLLMLFDGDNLGKALHAVASGRDFTFPFRDLSSHSLCLSDAGYPTGQGGSSFSFKPGCLGEVHIAYGQFDLADESKQGFSGLTTKSRTICLAVTAKTLAECHKKMQVARTCSEGLSYRYDLITMV